MPSTKKAAKRQPKPKQVEWPAPKPSADSDDDNEEEEEVDPIPCTNCQVCISVKTTRRCSVCGVCVLCSTACERRYMADYDGLAACNVHMPSKLAVDDPFAIKAMIFAGVDRACMGLVRQCSEPAEALSRALEWMLGVISLDPEVPLHENTVVGLSLAPFLGNKYSVGVKRATDMQFSSNTSKNAMLIVMLNRLVRLALSQQLLHADKVVEGAHIGPLIFLLGKPVRHPTLNTHVLQLDLIRASHTRLYTPSNLVCACDNDTVVECHTFFAQRMAVVQHKQVKGILGFDAGFRPAPVTTEGLRPLLTEFELAHALSRPTTHQACAEMVDYSSS